MTVKRWAMVCRSIDGVEQHRTTHFTRAGALTEAAQYRSPFYDVFVERPDGRNRIFAFPHVPPEQFAKLFCDE